MKNTMNRRIMISVIIAFILFALIMIGRLVYTAIDDNETTSNIPLKEYNDLFTKEANINLKVLATVKSKNRLPVSTYLYNSIYNVCVVKLSTLNNSSLNNIIIYEGKPSSKSLNAVYSALPSTNFNMSIKQGESVKSVKTLYFDFEGDLMTRLVANDSLYCYYYKFKSFSIHYNNAPYDIIANADNANQLASIVFIKKKTALYIVLMSSAKDNVTLPSDELVSIINK